MKISFVIPAYNEEKLLPQCVASIERELARGAYDAEIIVVNNASTDKTGEIARSFAGVKVIDEPRKGLTRARQAGYEASGGDLIANLDADTMLTPTWIPKALKAFAEDEQLVALSGPFLFFDLPLWKRVITRMWISTYPLINVFMHDMLHVGAILQGGNFILRRSALERAGGFDTSIEFYGEDTDIARRMSRVGKVRWTLRFPIYASGRRLQYEGMVATAWHYVVNFLWISFTGKPYAQDYTDIRR